MKKTIMNDQVHNQSIWTKKEKKLTYCLPWLLAQSSKPSSQERSSFLARILLEAIATGSCPFPKQASPSEIYRREPLGFPVQWDMYIHEDSFPRNDPFEDVAKGYASVCNL